ncbi:MAG: hypothetical protein MUO63_18355 [Desulfobulbaceae bacterium]|nr:hypothetical protein [Desulfobulbaceae bacterium]
MNEYLSFDKQAIGQISLDEICLNLQSMKSNFHSLQYVVIAFHSALQCYLTIALRGTSGINTWKKNHAKKWLKALENNHEFPCVQLDYFMELYDKLFKNEESLNREDIEYLNDTRNEFIHFVTDCYSLHIPSIFQSCKVALDAIQKTPGNSEGICFYYEEQETKFISTCNKISMLLKEVEQLYDNKEFNKEYFATI